MSVAENYKRSIAGKLTKDPLTVPSIVRQAQYDNLVVFMEKVQEDESILKRWLEVEKKRLNRIRKKTKALIEIKDCEKDCVPERFADAA